MEDRSASPAPLLLIIDEFTHLIQSDPPLASVLQKVWDHRLSKIDHLRLVLTGSLVGVMESEVLSGHAPLYGRATTLLRLRPLPFGILRELFPAWPPAERVAVYAVCGGVPAYLSLFAGSARFGDGLKACLALNSIMLTDAALLLSDRLREPHIHESVLASIASGFHTWGEIARIACVSEGGLGYYIRTLLALELIERRDPVLVAAGGRRGRYYVRDAFLRFYYRFIVPQRTAIERGALARAAKTIGEDLRAFIGAYVFEELCREWMVYAADTGALDFLPEVVGAFWTQHRHQPVQLDVVAASRREKRLFIGEAKWRGGSLSRDVLTDLVRRSQRMPQVTEPGWRVQYGLFAREGFTDATRQAAAEIGARLVDLAGLENTLVEGATRLEEPRFDEIEF